MSESHIVFGTGPLGRWTAQALLEMGKSVRMINRSGKMTDPPDGVEIIASDAFDVEKNIQFTKGDTVIYQCAQPLYYEWQEKFPPLQRAILTAAIENRSKLIIGDNLYMYGQFTGSLKEDSPVQPNTKKGRVRAAMAQEIMNAWETGKVKAAIGRGSDFFGPYDNALTGYAIRPAVEGKTINLMGSLNQPHSFTYIKDFGRLLATLGTDENSLGQIWFAPSNHPIDQKDFVKLIEKEIGKPVKFQVGGPFLMCLLGLFNKEIAETVEMMFEWVNPYVVDTSKAQNMLGLKPTPLETAINETIEWCRKSSHK